MTDFDRNLDQLLDEWQFEPNGWDFAVEIGIRADERDRMPLGELPHAMRAEADEAVLERLTDAAIEQLWNEELADWIREGIIRLGTRSDWQPAADRALAEFDRDPRTSDVGREVVRHLAMQLSFDDGPFVCLDCLDAAVSRAEPGDRRSIAIQAAVVASGSVRIPLLETAASDPAAHDSSIIRLGTHDRRSTVRASLGRLGAVGRDSMPALAAELVLIGDEYLPDRAAEDDVWRVVCSHLLRLGVRPERN